MECIVFIPLYNFKHYADRCFASIHSQMYRPTTLVIVDDGSTDGTAEIAKSWRPRLEGVGISIAEWITNEKNGGPGYTKWQAIQVAARRNPNGFFVIVDGDDYLTRSDSLEIIALTYRRTKCLFTYGSSVGKFTNQASKVPDGIDDPRKMSTDGRFIFSHPRSCSTRLLREFRSNDFKMKGTFLRKCTDRPFIYKCVDLAGPERVQHISDQIYCYDLHRELTTMNEPEEYQKQTKYYTSKMPRSPKLVTYIHVVMCLWKRRSVRTVLENLASQSISQRLVVHLVNNNTDESFRAYVRDEVEPYDDGERLRVNLYESETNLFGYARFLLVKKIMQNQWMQYVIFLDDDQILDPSALECMEREGAGALRYHTWWNRSWQYPYELPISYGHIRSLNSRVLPKNNTGSHYVHYGGTGGSIIDASIFETPHVFRCPPEMRNMEDLWLSHVVRTQLGGSVTGMQNTSLISFDMNIAKTHAQYITLRDNKQICFERLVKDGFLVGKSSGQLFSDDDSDVLVDTIRWTNTFNSKRYWKDRYRDGKTSGSGSYGRLATFKAEIINNFIEKNDIENVIDLGCGDGNQLGLLNLKKYTGLDVSKKLIEECREKFPNFNFYYSDTFQKQENQSFDLALSLDVIYHLVENEIYEEYMKKLISFDAKYVIIYSCNFKNDGTFNEHVNPRVFTDNKLLNEKYSLTDFIKNDYPFINHKEGSFSDFYIYTRK